jgi:hypothetical protein
MTLRDRLLEKDAPFAVALLLALAGWSAQRLYSNFVAADAVLVSSSSSEETFEGVLENTSRTLAATKVILAIDTGGRKPIEAKTYCVSLPPFDTPSSTSPVILAERVSCPVDVLHPGQTVRLKASWQKGAGEPNAPPRFLLSLPDQKGPAFVERQLLHRIGKEATYVLVGILLVSLVLCVFLLLGGRRGAR